MSTIDEKFALVKSNSPKIQQGTFRHQWILSVNHIKFNIKTYKSVLSIKSILYFVAEWAL
jgi:hypothetical protein